MYFAFGNQHFGPIQNITSFHLQNDFLETKNIGFKENLSIQQNKLPSFYDLTMEKKEITCNDQISPNLCILFLKKHKSTNLVLVKFSQKKKKKFQ